jgi:hypothetical protein
MVKELQHVVAQVEREPEDVQRQIAEVIAMELEERTWQRLVSTPESQHFLAQLAGEARAEIAAGTTRDLDELL